MTDMQTPMPDYTDPPVVEVALSVQFEPIASLHTTQIGLLWQEFRDRFPTVEEHPPLEPVFERFGATPKLSARGVQFQVMPAPPVPRCWFLNQPGTELIQVQSDRFVHNWRRNTGQENYPRYQHLRETFSHELGAFHKFLEREGLGSLCANQCEITYVNHIVSGRTWNDLGDLDKILTMFTLQYSDQFLGKPEDIRTAIRYVIRDTQGEPIGRLHVVTEPGYRTSDDRPIYVMNLTARGRPMGEGIDGILSFLDLGRDWVVRGFTSITTPQMHAEWRRRNGHGAA
jgi:uncharacterized protein (TIGR04255 family)